MSSSFINIQDTFPKKKRSSTSGISEFYLRNRRDKTGLIYYLHHKQIPGQRQAKMRKRKRKRTQRRKEKKRNPQRKKIKNSYQKRKLKRYEKKIRDSS